MWTSGSEGCPTSGHKHASAARMDEDFLEPLFWIGNIVLQAESRVTRLKTAAEATAQVGYKSRPDCCSGVKHLCLVSSGRQTSSRSEFMVAGDICVVSDPHSRRVVGRFRQPVVAGTIDRRMVADRAMMHSAQGTSSPIMNCNRSRTSKTRSLHELSK